ncbi:MAG: hypothetical protein GY913_24475 [Proteobacteria bacterium]|nr:hypothetical protein [Pseudomonadota bacterium]MCP4920070.1 hypothetical protein [Pseudomonadota bacterium]
MSSRSEPLLDSPEIAEADGLDLPVPEHVPMDLDEMCLAEEDAGDDITDLSFLDAPEPMSLEPVEDDVEELLEDDPSVQGFLPPPDHPRGEQGFLLLTTDEQDIRGRMLITSEDERDGLSRGENALRDWRIKAGLRDKEAAEREFELRARRRVRMGVAAGLVALIGAAAWTTTMLLDPPTAEPKPPPITPAVLAAVAGPAAAPELVDNVVTVPTRLWAPPVHDETLKSWVVDDYRYWQFDFASAGPMELRWMDPSGAVQLDDYRCDNRIDADLGRCYVGRNLERFRALVANGAPAGAWTLVGCVDGRCGPVTTFEVGESPSAPE